jgi:hypothetical protein
MPGGSATERMRTMPGSAGGGREVLFEFTTLGASVRGVAIDAETGTEVVAIAPANTAQADLRRLLLGKLKSRLDSAAR